MKLNREAIYKQIEYCADVIKANTDISNEPINYDLFEDDEMENIRNSAIAEYFGRMYIYCQMYDCTEKARKVSKAIADQFDVTDQSLWHVLVDIARNVYEEPETKYTKGKLCALHWIMNGQIFSDSADITFDIAKNDFERFVLHNEK